MRSLLVILSTAFLLVACGDNKKPEAPVVTTPPAAQEAPVAPATPEVVTPATPEVVTPAAEVVDAAKDAAGAVKEEVKDAATAVKEEVKEVAKEVKDATKP